MLTLTKSTRCQRAKVIGLILWMWSTTKCEFWEYFANFWVQFTPWRWQWCNLILPQWFWATKVCLWVKFPKYVCFVTRLGKQLFEKEILTIILDILWKNGINSYQFNTAWAILFISDTHFWCLLIPPKVTPHHVRVLCLIIV